MTTEAVIEKVKSAFTCHDQELEYNEEEFRFVWRGDSTAFLPRESGVYCLFSHNGSRLQKIGKAESTGGLRDRFRGYTGAKTAEKIAGDRTDQLWKKIMTDKLRGQPLRVYYYVTVPKKFESPIRFDDSFELNCHWARSFEAYLSKIVRNECRKKDLLDTHMLLSGLAD